MENLRNALEIFFLREDPEKVLNSFYKSDKVNYDLEMDNKTYADFSEVLNPYLNREESYEIHKMAKDVWFHDMPYSLKEEQKYKIFNIIKYFANSVLIEETNCPICEFDKLLKWREISYKLGEDIFTTAFFANADLISKRSRDFFSWSPIIKTNDVALNRIIKQGLSELHYHLYGSSLNFEIGWLSLMNDIQDRERDFNAIKKSKYPDYNLYFNNEHLSLYVLYVKAFAIRLYLFMRITKNLLETNNEKNGDYANENKSIEIRKIFHNIILASSYEEVKIYIPELIDYVSTYKMICGKKYRNGVVDYAIRQNLSEQNYDEKNYMNVILSGERWLLYKMFKKIFSNDKKFESLVPMFYAYLIIKSKIRAETVQLNPLHGFSNFQEYQNRKVHFIKPESLYMELIVSCAITNSFNNQNVKYLEARITPSVDVQENINTITQLDKIIKNNDYCNITNEECNNGGSNKQLPYFYVYHFIKKGEDIIKETDLLCRNYKLRKDVEYQTKAINTIRKNYINTSNRIVGLDAASLEIGHRPEVFAQAYRYLKKYSYTNQVYDKVIRNSFGYTYHVGEDFLDLADGLRAIDEVIKFLQFGRGDRLGHAIALAVDATLYYKKRHNLVVMPQIELLDNIVWLLMQNQKYNLQISGTLRLELENLYWTLYCKIYKIELIPLEIYYQSWLLRGDNPELYNNIDVMHFNALTFWQRVGKNDTDETNNARINEKARLLYHMYHYDQHVRNEGNKTIEYPISDEYIQLIKKLQKAMQNNLAKLHISIETNPTSNKLIGPIDKYIEHPIINMYNLHLEHDYEKCYTCSQLSVSINTDDSGVFSTSLDNEYALLAIALEKEKDENGNPKYQSRHIYNWLESIRQMGEEQRFVKE